MSRMVEIDIEDAKSILVNWVCDDHAVTGQYKRLKEAIHKAEMEDITLSQREWSLQERQKDEMFKLNSDLTTKLNFAMDRIDELSKRVEELENNV